MHHQAIRSYIILGGGTAGWMTAALLGRVLNKTDVKITLVESSSIGTVGVGEASVPSFVDFIKILGISEQEFIEKTNATFKLGIKFSDWREKGHSYWHPFGRVGTKIDGHSFFQHWLRSKSYGNKSPFTHYSPSAMLAQHGKFYIPDPRNPNNLYHMGYALHFDANLVAQFLQQYAAQYGVQKVEGSVEYAERLEDERIKSLHLKSGQIIEGDFFIDCSGQQAVLIGQALNVEYDNWEKYLPVNKALILQSNVEEELPPFTEAIAEPCGWRWKIPLQNRVGNGYVYSDKYCSDQQAEDHLIKKVQATKNHKVKQISFTTGKRRYMMRHNCLAVGLSSGFLEPLESTSIYLVMRAILRFVEYLPNQSLCQSTQNEYNRLMDLEYENIRDFIFVHYCLSKRQDSEFWRDWFTRPIPNTLENKLSIYQSQGYLRQNEADLFACDSWYAVLSGMGFYPDCHSSVINSSDINEVIKYMRRVEQSLMHSVKQLKSHKNYLREFLAPSHYS